jgi:hypothetical protein
MLYTFIMEFRGGTYVSQVESKSMNDACNKWANNIDVSAIKYFNEAIRKKLLLEITNEEDKPSKLKGLRNIFYAGVILGRHIAHISIVLTK